MTTTIWAILAPVLFLAWLTESNRERAQRLRRAGWSQQRIADHLGVTRYRVRLFLIR
jgi:transcriptional regulator